MKRIFHFISAVQAGGAEVVALSIAENCREHFHESHIVTVRRPKYVADSNFRADFVKRIAEAGAILHEIGDRGFPFTAALNVSRFIRRLNITKHDVIHLHSDIPEFVGALATIGRRLTVVRTIHNTVFWPGRSLLARVVEGRLSSAHRVGVSHAALQAHTEFLARLNVKNTAETAVVYNGVSALFPEKANELNWKTNAINVLFVGRLDLQKGPDILVAAAKLLPEPVLKKFHFHLVGTGRMHQQLAGDVRMFELPFTFYGSIHNARQFMPQADLVIVPSRFEGFGLSAVEAILAGSRVFAASCTGLAEVFPENHQDLFETGNSKELANKLVDFESAAGDDKFQPDEKLIARAEQMFTVGAMAAGYSRIYSDLATRNANDD